MNVRKFQADQLFTGTNMLQNKVLICDEAGAVLDIVEETEAGDEIEKFTGVLSPGLVNCHCHLELSHLLGLIPEKTGLIKFVYAVVTQRHFAEEEILRAIQQAEIEMIDNGIVAVGDICNNLDTLTQKLKKNIHYHNFVEVAGWLPAIAEQRFERSRNYYKEYRKIFPTSIVPHAAYSVSKDLWKLITPYFKDKVVTIHNQETAFEDELFLSNSGDLVKMYEMMKIDHSFYKPSGKTSVQTCFKNLAAATQVLLVHNTYTGEEDIKYIKASGYNVSFCLCVNANLYIEGNLPPIDKLRQHSCSIVLGTDSLASNKSLSIVNEMKTIQKNFPDIGLQEMLLWGTWNGAKALQMEDTLGSFEKGKKPGVILIDANLNKAKRLH